MDKSDNKFDNFEYRKTYDCVIYVSRLPIEKLLVEFEENLTLCASLLFESSPSRLGFWRADEEACKCGRCRGPWQRSSALATWEDEANVS